MTTRLVRALPLAALLATGLAASAAAADVSGTTGPDVLFGTTGADTLRGFDGDDVLRGRYGNDVLYGGRGADEVYGGKDLRPDVLYGRAGDDRLYVRGRDTAHAGWGDDVVVALPYSGFYTVTVTCGPGYDHVVGINPWLLSLPNGHGCEVVDYE